MTKEQERSVEMRNTEERLHDLIDDIRQNKIKVCELISEEGKYNLADDLETVLSMLKEKDKLYNKALSDLVKADRENIQLKKQIDLMANYIVNLIKYNNPEEIREVEEIKQYFERKNEE